MTYTYRSKTTGIVRTTPDPERFFDNRCPFEWEEVK